jgi:co-chaperonin GroES (HSP10)
MKMNETGLRIGGSTNPINALDVTGNIYATGSVSTGGVISVSTEAASAYAMSVFNDGNASNRYGMSIRCGSDTGSGSNYLMGFYDGDYTWLGGIIFTNNDVTYAEFTGAHFANLADNTQSYTHGTILKIVSASSLPGKTKIDYVCAHTEEDKEKTVLGVYGADLVDAPDEELRTKHSVLSVGDGHVLVCSQNGNIETGDYICSSNTEGHGMKQDDDLLHNYTVAKASEPVVWSEESGIEKLIACTYHCG